MLRLSLVAAFLYSYNQRHQHNGTNILTLHQRYIGASTAFFISDPISMKQYAVRIQGARAYKSMLLLPEDVWIKKLTEEHSMNLALPVIKALSRPSLE